VEKLRAWIIVVGVITLFLGLLLMGISGASRVNVETVAKAEDSWTVTGGPFKKGDRLKVYYPPPANWRLPPYLTRDDIPEAGGVPTKIVGINISHPIGGSTIISDVLAPESTKVPLGESMLVKVLIFSEEGQNESLNINAYWSRVLPETDIVRYYLEETGGTVKYDGFYTVHIFGPIPAAPQEPPDPPDVYLIRERTVHPYTHIFFPGVATTLSGCLIIVWGLIGKSSKLRKKKA
jgi:hypothetical protein